VVEVLKATEKVPKELRRLKHWLSGFKERLRVIVVSSGVFVLILKIFKIKEVPKFFEFNY